MKLFIALTLLISASAMANNCPTGSRVLLACSAVDAADDYALAQNFVKELVDLCEDTKSGNLTLVLDGLSKEALPVTEVVRIGETSYVYENEAMKIELVRTLISGGTLVERFYLSLPSTPVRMYRTVKCQ